MEYDLIIIGMGISGISAAIYAKNSGLNILMLEREMPGGLINKTNSISNYPGLEKISGPDFALKLFNTVQDMQIPYKIQEVKKIQVKQNKKIVKTSTETFETKKVLIATGRKNKQLHIKNEEELLGHGISTCALCDGSLYKEKEIAIVGGGNSAVEEAIYLSGLVKKIYMIHRRDKFRADEKLIQELNEKENIEYLWNSKVTSIKKEQDKLSEIVINDEKKLTIAGLFLYIGFEPNIECIKDLNITDEEGYIKVNENYETKLPGIFAVGDAIKKDVYQLITAANDGAIAAINICKDIKKR